MEVKDWNCMDLLGVFEVITKISSLMNPNGPGNIFKSKVVKSISYRIKKN